MDGLKEKHFRMQSFLNLDILNLIHVLLKTKGRQPDFYPSRRRPRIF